MTLQNKYAQMPDFRENEEVQSGTRKEDTYKHGGMRIIKIKKN